MQVTFQVNAITPQAIQGPLPYTTSTYSESDMANSVVVYLPNGIRVNRYLDTPVSSGNLTNGNGYLSHGDTFTATDFEALYLINNYTTGLYPILSVISRG